MTTTLPSRCPSCGSLAFTIIAKPFADVAVHCGNLRCGLKGAHGRSEFEALQHWEQLCDWRTSANSEPLNPVLFAFGVVVVVALILAPLAAAWVAFA